MLHSARIGRSFLALLPCLAVALVLGVLGGHGPRAFAEGEDDPVPPSGMEEGMADPAMGDEPAMGGEPAMGDEEGDGDEADGPVPFQEAVNKAIEKGVRWLKSKQLPDGSWGVIDGGQKYDPNAKGESYKHPAGPTALALYALLKCRVPAEDPVVKKGFKYLKDRYRIPGGSYEVSALLLAVTATADPFKRVKASTAAGERIKLTGEFRKWAQDLQMELLKKRGSNAGWRYNHGGTEPDGHKQDLSSTQFACLALFAAERCGIKTDSKIWNAMITFAMAQQEEDGPLVTRAVTPKPSLQEPTKPGDDPKGRYANPDGEVKDKARGFAYIKGAQKADEGEACGSMTACGLGTVLLARYVLGNRKDKLWEKRDQKAVQTSIYDGLAWLDVNWSSYGNPKKMEGQHENPYFIYWMYCLERTMDLVGNQLLGKHQWYVEMGQQLVNRQKQQGFWHSGTTLNPQEVLDTCFALLFLKRATRGGIPYPSVTNTGEGDEPIDNRGK